MLSSRKLFRTRHATEAQAGGHAERYSSTAAPLAVSMTSMLPLVALE
jgi:hypothetical protein